MRRTRLCVVRSQTRQRTARSQNDASPVARASGRGTSRRPIAKAVVSLRSGHSPYGDRPVGGYAFAADSLVGYRRVRDNEGRVVQVPVKQSILMPAGTPVNLATDLSAPLRAINEFMAFLKQTSALNRAAVLDGAESFFQIRYGMNSATASALAKFVRARARNYGSRGNLTCDDVIR